MYHNQQHTKFRIRSEKIWNKEMARHSFARTDQHKTQMVWKREKMALLEWPEKPNPRLVGEVSWYWLTSNKGALRSIISTFPRKSKRQIYPWRNYWILISISLLMLLPHKDVVVVMAERGRESRTKYAGALRNLGGYMLSLHWNHFSSRNTRNTKIWEL